MNPRLVAILSALCIAAVLAVLAVSMGLVPALEPPFARTLRLDPEKAVEPSRMPEAAKEPEALPTLSLARFPLCRPRAGARAFIVSLGAEREGVLVFCEGGYELFSFELGSVPVRARRVARFPTKAANPGGAAGGDFDGDGIYDLALGLAPKLGVQHESGVGAFWVRGRREGGYEAPRSLAEVGTQAIVAADLDGAPPTDLVLLTRGDVSAQRAGELWTYTKGPLLARQRVVGVGLDPRDLMLREGETQVLAWVVTGQPGAVLAITLPRDAAQKPSELRIALPGAQAFVPFALAAPLVRTPSSLFTLEGDPLAAAVWAENANVGPAVQTEPARDGERLLAALPHGVAELSRDGEAVRDELSFGDDARVLDVVPLSEAQGPRRALVLVESEQELAAILVPAPPWAAGATLRIEPHAVEVAHGFADVPLE